MLLCCNDCRGRQTIIWTQNKMSRVAANLWLHLWRCLCEHDHRRSSTPSVPTTSWRSETAAQRRVRCSAVSAATTNPTTLRAAPTSCGWSSCLTALSTKLGLQPTFSKVRLSVSWRVLCFLTLVTPLCQFFFFFFLFCQKWTSAPVQTKVTVSSAVWTHWAATDVPVTLGMSWQLINAAVTVSAEHDYTTPHVTLTESHCCYHCLTSEPRPQRRSVSVFKVKTGWRVMV